MVNLKCILNFYFFIFGCAGSSLLLRLFSDCIEWRLVSNCSAQASHCSGFSCCRAQAPGHTSFSSCGTRAQSLQLRGSRTTGSTVSLQFTGLVTPWHVGSSQTWDQTPCLLHQQADSLSTSHPVVNGLKSPLMCTLNKYMNILEEKTISLATSCK